MVVLQKITTNTDNAIKSVLGHFKMKICTIRRD